MLTVLLFSSCVLGGQVSVHNQRTSRQRPGRCFKMYWGKEKNQYNINPLHLY